MNKAYQLNPEQQEAVTHTAGPLLIIAGAGTGKTTVITERIKYLVTEKNLRPEQILALTFSEKAAREMEERVDRALPYGYTEMWLSTFHAFCDRVLRADAFHIGLDPAYKLTTQSEIVLFMRKNLFKFNLDYFRPLGNPTKFLEHMLNHFDRLRDEDIMPDEYLNWAQSQKAKDQSDEETKKNLELAHAFKMFEELKVQEGLMDFPNLIAHTLALFRQRKNILAQYQSRFEYVLIDEFQDTNYAQNQLAILLAGEKANITVVGDDDQCLPGNSLIHTPTGSIRIDKIKLEDDVLTGIGRGAIGISKVKNIHVTKKLATFLTITTKSGKKVMVTDNHKMFCYVPKIIPRVQFYYVYLMYRKNLGYRLGITRNLAVRLKVERSADTITGLRAFNSEEEARYHEVLWSLKYQIPTSILKIRKSVMMQDEYVQRLYTQFNTEENAQKLAYDLGIDLKEPQYQLDAVTRGGGKRVIINVMLCNRNYAVKQKYNKIIKKALVSHTVYLETSNNEVIKKVIASGIDYTKSKKGIRIRKQFTDITAAGLFAKKLVNLTGGFIEYKAALGKLNSVSLPAAVIPAGNLLEGLFIPVLRNNEIYYEEIIKIDKVKKSEPVYDLEIDRTHNFIANDIVVHNSIYRWRGAALSNMLQFKKNYPKSKIITLINNYRSTQKILDSSYKLIQNNNPDRLEVKEHINKRLIPSRSVIGDDVSFLFSERVEEEAEKVVKKIEELLHKKKNDVALKDIAILVRANDHAGPFIRALERFGIPHQFLGPGKLFLQEEIKDLLAYLKVLYNFEDSTSLYRVLTMDHFAVNPRDIAALLNYAKRNNCSLFEALEKIDEIVITSQTKDNLLVLLQTIKEHLARVSKDTAGQILYDFLKQTKLVDSFASVTTEEEERHVKNIAKFFDKLKGFEAQYPDASVFAVTDWVELSMQLGESPLALDSDWNDNNAVSLLTIHSSKGLEFKVVFLVNLVSERFPSRERREPIPIPGELIKEILPVGDYHLQEERRLFYVGVTRAKDKLFLTAAKFYGEGKREKKISPFIVEALDEDVVKKAMQQDAEKAQLSLFDFGTQSAIVVTPNTNIIRSTIPITYLSYSQLQTFSMCPLHYKLRYILKIPVPQAASAASLGTSMHEALRLFYQAVKDGEKLKPQDVLRYLEKAWIRYGYQSKEHERQAFEKAKENITRYMEKNFVDGHIPLALETPFMFPIRGLKVGGRVDRIDTLPDGRIEIIDYKTGSNVPSQRDVDKNLQLTMYGLAATKISDKVFGHNPDNIVLTLDYIDEGVRLSTTRTKEQLDAAEEEINKKAEEISVSDFLCSGSIFCRQCEYSMLCSVKN